MHSKKWGVHSTPNGQHTYGVLTHQKAKGVLAHHIHYYIALKLVYNPLGQGAQI